ncbi:hypothetical protein HYV50_00745 [Candidatus Pacearchaeota archaeon]|nr:hypothetical protein [Candidatus Pacearchaeota archaeon]
MALKKLFHSLLLKVDAERAHNIGKWAMKHKLFAPERYQTPESKTSLFDTDLPNPFGIAAGFDKYAELQDVVQNYGFAYIELGSFTWLGGEGFQGVRLVRLKSGALLNRMGLNGPPAATVREKLLEAKNPYSFASNITKTNDHKIKGDKAIEDIVLSYNELKDLGIYIAINVSCPNTSQEETFEDPAIFNELVSALKKERKIRPVVYKFSPVTNDEERKRLEKLVEISHAHADGYEATNTLPLNHVDYWKGGLSGGALLRTYAINTIKFLRKLTAKPIIGVGGISTGADSYEMYKAGANIFLTFTGFVYRHPENPYAGPNFAHFINEDHFSRIAKDIERDRQLQEFMEKNGLFTKEPLNLERIIIND